MTTEDVIQAVLARLEARAKWLEADPDYSDDLYTEGYASGLHYAVYELKYRLGEVLTGKDS
jgi:hypothetical protein